ncbi:MAG: zinc dependent phospholipase C family protein [Vicinamibacterales bacterium]
MRNRAVAALITVFVAVLPAPADAWGFEAHKYIMARAINLLPAQLRPYFEANRAFLIEHAIDPDLWRTVGWEEESARHYVDMDAYGAYPFNDLPHDYDAAIQKFGKEFVQKNGTLPWRAEEIYLKLVEAFQQKAPYSRDNIRLFSAIVTHYVSDAQVPFHASLNHDGQLTQQWGIHSRFEAELFERYRTQLRVVPQPLVQVAGTRELMFESLTSGFPYVQQILDADKQATNGRELYDDGYFRMMFARVRPILEIRLSESVTRAASVISAAWTEAGRPAVAVKAPPRRPRTIRRQ